MSRYDDSLAEGWGVIRPGDRRAHYYRELFSLCNRVGFYSGPLEADGMPSPDDCKACRRVLDAEAKAQGGETAAHVAQGIKDSEEER